MAFGIDFSLNTPVDQTVTISGFEVSDMTLDFDKQEIVIAYDRLGGGQRLDQERVVTVDGQQAADMFARAEQIATAQSETVIRALYYVATEVVRDRLGVSGTINVA